MTTITRNAETVASNNASATIIGAMAYHRQLNQVVIVVGKSRKIQAESFIMRGSETEPYFYNLKSAPAMTYNTGEYAEVNNDTSVRINALVEVSRPAYVRGIGVTTVIGHMDLDGQSYWLLAGDLALAHTSLVHFVTRAPRVSQRRARVSVGLVAKMVQ